MMSFDETVKGPYPSFFDWSVSVWPDFSWGRSKKKGGILWKKTGCHCSTCLQSPTCSFFLLHVFELSISSGNSLFETRKTLLLQQQFSMQLKRKIYSRTLPLPRLICLMCLACLASSALPHFPRLPRLPRITFLACLASSALPRLACLTSLSSPASPQVPCLTFLASPASPASPQVPCLTFLACLASPALPRLRCPALCYLASLALALALSLPAHLLIHDVLVTLAKIPAPVLMAEVLILLRASVILSQAPLFVCKSACAFVRKLHVTCTHCLVHIL